MCDLCGPDRAQTVVDHKIGHPFRLEPGTDMECAECQRHLSVHPDKVEFLKRRETDLIMDHGFQVNMIGAYEEGEIQFAYSAGRTVYERPELLVHGILPTNVMAYMINRVAEIDLETPIKAGDLLNEVLEGYSVNIVAVADLEAAKMFGAIEYGATEALQILWPDMEGNFPGDEGYDSACIQRVFE